MADIEVVVKIPEEKYLYAKSLVNGGKENNPVVLAIGNGTPLPKGHGRLIDADELKKNIQENDVLYTMGFNVRICDINDAQTIIEADMREKT